MYLLGSSGGGTGGPDTLPEKTHTQEYIWFLSNTGPDPLKNPKATIQYWVIIGTPAKRHLIAFRCRTDDGPAYDGIWILPPLVKQQKD